MSQGTEYTDLHAHKKDTSLNFNYLFLEVDSSVFPAIYLVSHLTQNELLNTIQSEPSQLAQWC